MDLVIFLLIGLVVGWLASNLVRGRGLGCLGDTIVGIVGALLGGWLLGWLGVVPQNGLASFLAALLGAVILLVLIKAVKRA